MKPGEAPTRISPDYPMHLLVTYRGTLTGTVMGHKIVGPFTDLEKFNAAVAKLDAWTRDRTPEAMRYLCVWEAQHIEAPDEWRP